MYHKASKIISGIFCQDCMEEITEARHPQRKYCVDCEKLRTQKTRREYSMRQKKLKNIFLLTETETKSETKTAKD